MLKKIKTVKWPFVILITVVSGITIINHSCTTNDSNAAIPAGAKTFPIAGYAAYDGNSDKVGTVLFVDWPNTALEFSDGTVGQFHIMTGKYSTGICETSDCALKGIEIYGTEFIDRGYCSYTSIDCSGTCYVNSKPLANSLYIGPSGFLLASGSESSAGAISGLSAYRHDLGDCLVSGGTFSNGYGVTTSHTLDPSVSYPFATPMYFIAE